MATAGSTMDSFKNQIVGSLHTMARSLKSMLAELSADRRAWIEAKGREMADDMIRYADAHAGRSLPAGQDPSDCERHQEQSDVDLDGDPGRAPS